MIVTVEELRQHVDTAMDDQALEAKLQALESSIKGYTHNNFKRVLEENNGQYPADIKQGVVELLKWDLQSNITIGVSSRAKDGIASESLSRHSVTYEGTKTEDYAITYPKKMLGFLTPYICARFGQRGGYE